MKTVTLKGKKHYYHMAKVMFLNQFKEFVITADLVPQDTEIKKGEVKLDNLRDIKIIIMEDEVTHAPYDMRFKFAFMYEHWYDYDTIEEVWTLNKSPDLEKVIYSKVFYGVFRDLVKHPIPYIAHHLRERRINFICMQDYEGGKRRQELINDMRSMNVYCWVNKKVTRY